MRFLKLSLLLLACLLVGCTDNDNPIEDPISQKTVRHLVFIGLDGWGGYNLDLTKMPTIFSLKEQGVWTLSKQAVMPSGSGQNWTTMFMGVGPEIHGYTNWDSTAPSIQYDFDVKNNIFPTVFQILREQKPESEIGVFFQWDKIRYFVDSLSVSYMRSIPLIKGHECITDSVKKYITDKKPTLCAVIYDDPDHTGHKEGYFSEKYYDVLIKLDSCINEIVKTTKQVGIYDETVFIITSDHGGLGNAHGGDSPNEINTPFFMFGRSVKKWDW